MELPLSEWYLPLLGGTPVIIIFSKFIRRKKVTTGEVRDAIIGFLVVLFSVNENYNHSAQGKASVKTTDSLNKALDTLRLNVAGIQDTLQSTRDTLLRVGLKIDKTTGRIEIVNSKILEAVLRLQPSTTGVPDSLNFETVMHDDTLLVYPKEGAWAHGYIAFDTANSDEFGKPMYMGMGSANPVDKIIINGKTYLTHVWSAFSVATHKGQPWGIKMGKETNRYIIFGEDGDVSKRYIYKNGKVKWIPETRRRNSPIGL